MTKDEILNLSGLELRKAVAKVKGYETVPAGRFYDYGSCTYKDGWMLFPDLHPKGGQPKTKEEAWLDAPAYESDMGAAWELAEEYRFTVTPGYCVNIGRYGYDVFHANAGGWTQDVQYVGTTNYQDWTFGDTAPEAICRAYLLAKRRRGELDD